MLSDNQRRLICRFLFLLCCCVPTGLVVYAIFHQPNKHQIMQAIKADLGIDVSLDALRTPRPGVMVLHGLKFSDPDFGKLFEAAEVRVEIGVPATRGHIASELDTNEPGEKLEPTENVVRIDHTVNVTNRGLMKLVELINENVIRRHQTTRPWRIVINKPTTIFDASSLTRAEHLPERSLAIENLEILMVTKAGRTDTDLSFQLVDYSASAALTDENYSRPWVQAYFGRSRQDNSLFLVKLETQRASLPCWLIGDLVPELAGLGPDCHYNGHFWIFPPAQLATVNRSLKGEIKGKFTQIDRRLFEDFPVSSRNPYLEMEVRQCEIENGSVLNWEVDLFDGNFRQSLPPARSIADLNLYQAIRLAILPDTPPRPADRQYR